MFTDYGYFVKVDKSVFDEFFKSNNFIKMI